MASCGTPGSHTPGVTYTPSPMPQSTNPPSYEARPKIEVVKAKTRGGLAGDSKVNDDQSSQPAGQASRDVASEGPSQYVQEKHGEAPVKRSFDQAFTNTSASNGDETSKMISQTGPSDGPSNMPVIVPTAVSLPTSTGLPKSGANYGMDYWNGQGMPLVIGQEASRPHSVPGAYVHAAGNMSFHGPSSDGGSTDYWVQDEKELKRQRRKEANRESARRSRMRKQAECDELAEKVQALTSENESLKMEVDRLGELCQKLTSENHALLERLKK